MANQWKTRPSVATERRPSKEAKPDVVQLKTWTEKETELGRHCDTVEVLDGPRAEEAEGQGVERLGPLQARARGGRRHAFPVRRVARGRVTRGSAREVYASAQWLIPVAVTRVGH